MENIILIPTAKQARELVNKQSEELCSKIWNELLCLVKNKIETSIKECKRTTFIPAHTLRGLTPEPVYFKLKPLFEGMGYKISYNSNGLCISWEEENSESQ